MTSTNVGFGSQFSVGFRINKRRVVTFRIQLDRPTFRYSIKYGPDFDSAVHYLGKNICLDTIDENYAPWNQVPLANPSSFQEKRLLSILRIRTAPSFNEKICSYSLTS